MSVDVGLLPTFGYYVNHAAMDTDGQVSESFLSILWMLNLGVELLDHMVILFNFSRNPYDFLLSLA